MPNTILPVHSATILPARIGLIAGQGDFPLLIADAARSNGVEVVAFAINGFASHELNERCTKVLWLELGQLGKAIQLMHENGVKHLSMAGRVPHTSVLQYRHFDARALKLLAKSFSKKADALLGAVSAEFAGEGIEVMDSTLFLRSLMPAEGMLTRGKLSPEQAEDVEFGYPIAKAIAGQDIGQTVVVKDKMVIAVEGAEGTDACIDRAGELAGPGCVVIKVSKPAQDRRFDIPVVGPGTMKHLIRAKASVLAVSAGETLLFHREDVVAQAEANGVHLTAR